MQPKRQKTSLLRQTSVPHPYGIRPFGNSFSAIYDARTSMGHFNILNDEVLLLVLSNLGAEACSRLACASRGFLGYSYEEGNWRQFCIERFGGAFSFKINWRNTFKYKISREDYVRDTPLDCNIYSDLLFTSWRCATVDLQELTNPTQENIERRSGLSIQQFIDEYAGKKPVILTDIIDSWPARKWDFEYLLKREGLFRAEAVDMTFTDYYAYMQQCQEEAPLYLFDKKQALASDMAQDFTIPSYFSQDLFSVLENRPDYRWLIVGPERSGSSWHIDPNATCAWNAVIKGKKKWILSKSVPDGVYPSHDLSEVTSPVSLVEWYLNHYSAHSGMIEAVCKEGELLYIPSSWWHSVINLEPSIALTQNLVDRSNLKNVLKFLRTKSEQVSGYNGDLFADFMSGLKEKKPDLVYLSEEKKTQWEGLTESKSLFKFSF